ncbi:uncharacterized protein LOC131843013 [Achroia grisella]|uniref:Uncharacterized protein LOC113520964 n=1 Tax=Galleria mellonella TaxID=7137 RepID=A0A6J1X034_GALME|nr:uncharacterized protein LOC113520964 [Galleria mellonella]XP_052749045.1 uncharacterized protein LOC128200253 [Galleria mellonella]XP_052749417.1 uncharacterized protein LOC128200337 [Galleria mellonella]XP_052755934.1 uncharacterized protein LOC128201832 [Galleria mellonella]XP_052758744.1 uncharacterized protein LOC128202442 [Galleria mellonella]XP_059047324.1 uncharacterized protein LOC131842773 [Achroia grisella]XP_059047587.1 uncharacterized protein LOC131843013 [Achroia grisella]
MRNYKKTTERGTKSVELMKRAADLVANEDKSIRQVCRDYEISRTSLKRFMARLKENPESPKFGYGTPRLVFNQEQETSLCEYLLTLAQIFHGIGPKDVRRLAYECAVKYNLKIPEVWHTNKMAGKDWLTGFLSRNDRLSIRKPEATSLSRATSFNRTNVCEYFDKLAHVMDRHKFRGSSIWNADETGVSTVNKPSKIIAAKGKRNVGSVTSAERGTNVTLLVAVSATGSSIPPMFVFPRKKYQDHFVRDGPAECIGAGNASGWMTDTEFLLFMKHFITYVKPTKESPVLLLLDNHSSHLSVEVLDLAKNNGVVMLSYPPHCSHKLQPLDVSVFGPFKRYLSSAQDSWMRGHPGKTMSIYDIPGIVRTALPLALTPNNISKGFQKAGVYPFNREVFDESDFAPSFVTDRPNPNNPTTSSVPNESQPPMSTEPQLPISPGSPSLLISSQPEVVAVVSASISPVSPSQLSTVGPQLPTVSVLLSSSDLMLSSTAAVEKDCLPLRSCTVPSSNIEPQPSTSASSLFAQPSIFSPESIRPFPQAGPRNVTSRKRRKAAILTDTPEKEALSLEQENKKKKKMVSRKKAVSKKNKQVKKKILQEKDTNKNKQVKRKIIQEKDTSSSSEEEECLCLECCESFADSVAGEGWIQCNTCKGWAHDKCAKHHSSSLAYECKNCQSDED